MKVMKLDKLDEAIRLKKRLGMKEEKELEEDTVPSGMKKFDMQYTIDGVKSGQTVTAETPQKAEELVRKQYEGKNIIFTSKQEVHESLEESVVSNAKNWLIDKEGKSSKEAEEIINKSSPEEIEKIALKYTKSGKEDVEESLTEDLDTPSTPETSEATGLSNMIITAINDEWKTIAYYNDLVEILRQQGRDNMIPVIQDIANEENKHVGQLQEMMKQLSPNTVSIADGETEGSEQMWDEGFGPTYTPDAIQRMSSASIYDEIDYVPDDDFGTDSGFGIYMV